MKTKTEIKKEIKEITDIVDIDFTNEIIAMNENEFKEFKLTKQTLTNIGKWALDGKSQSEIANNLELTKSEWAFLCKCCPSIVMIMQKTAEYADLVVAGTLLQTAIGGKKILKEQPVKIKEYDKNGKVKGEHIEIAHYYETMKPDPDLLKFLATHKFSEKFGSVQIDNTKEHRQVIENMSEEERKLAEQLLTQEK